MAELVTEAISLCFDSTVRVSDSQDRGSCLGRADMQLQLNVPNQAEDREHKKKRRRGRIYLTPTSLPHAPLFLHCSAPFHMPLYSFLSTILRLCLTARFPPLLKKYSFDPGHPRSTSRPSARTYRPLLVSRSVERRRQRLRRTCFRHDFMLAPYPFDWFALLTQAPLPSVLEPRDLPRLLSPPQCSSSLPSWPSPHP